MSEPWKNRESWEPEPAATATGPGAALQAHVRAVWDGLRDLGMIKVGETWMVSHYHSCPTGRPPHDYERCTCPGGPELRFADWDELKPRRHTECPERFYEHH